MTREEVIERLVTHHHELQAQGVKSLVLFGSVARCEAHRTSPAIPWSQMSDIRNLVAHVCWGVDLHGL